MELSFLDLKEREIINVYDGKKLGRVIDIVFNNETGVVRGIIVPGDKKMFHRVDDVFIPIEKIKRIGNDVILVGIQREEHFVQNRSKKVVDKNIKTYENYYNRYYPNNNYRETDREYNSRRENSSLDKQNSMYYRESPRKQPNTETQRQRQQVSFVRLKPLDRKKYK